MSFKYDKENLFAEFKVAKEKDVKLSKRKSMMDKLNDYYTNRVQFCRDHIELKKQHPEYYDGIDVKFDNLLVGYQSVSPLDYFYNKVFGMSYAEKMRISDIELQEKKANEGVSVR
jgi:hypothetical protein